MAPRKDDSATDSSSEDEPLLSGDDGDSESSSTDESASDSNHNGGDNFAKNISDDEDTPASQPIKSPQVSLQEVEVDEADGSDSEAGNTDFFDARSAAAESSADESGRNSPVIAGGKNAQPTGSLAGPAMDEFQRRQGNGAANAQSGETAAHQLLHDSSDDSDSSSDAGQPILRTRIPPSGNGSNQPPSA